MQSLEKAPVAPEGEPVIPVGKSVIPVSEPVIPVGKLVVPKEEPVIHVGIVSAATIKFTLNGPFLPEGKPILPEEKSFLPGGKPVEGNQEVRFHEGKISCCGNEYTELSFKPLQKTSTFTLQDVIIGVNFHWERHEAQTFEGSLRFIVDGDKVCAINVIHLEDYLKSVISSEMSSTSSPELLKAHAVISRSWLLSQVRNRQQARHKEGAAHRFIENESTVIRWFDREEHTLFDVCADDHCQRYQGIGRIQNTHALAAIEATKGQVLMSDGELCDARFSKCCGGVSEEFRYCWDNIKYPYLRAVADVAPEKELVFPDLTDEANAEKWILSSEEAFCNTSDKSILRQVLNDYDQETADFYRWTAEFSQDELSALIQKKLGMDFGNIIDMVPLKRGKSGRIYELKIVGTKKTLVLGKELEIRRALSESHLYSSAFVVRKGNEKDGIPETFTLIGAGWGHGVGLCQIGAAVMGAKGYDYLSILRHYYQGATIEKLY